MRHTVDRCAALGLPTVPSHANFVCIEVGDDVGVTEALEREGFIVRPGSKIGMPGHIRVSAAEPEDAERFLDALGRATVRGAVSA
jgi:histidinol-phosphate aminotransferase